MSKKESVQTDVRGVGCPPSYKFGHGDWAMRMIASFGSGEDMCEIWRVGARMMLRVKDGGWMNCETTSVKDDFCGLLEGMRCAIIDGWPHERAFTMKGAEPIKKEAENLWSNVALSYWDIAKLLESACANGEFNQVDLVKFESDKILTPEIIGVIRSHLGIALNAHRENVCLENKERIGYVLGEDVEDSVRGVASGKKDGEEE